MPIRFKNKNCCYLQGSILQFYWPACPVFSHQAFLASLLLSLYIYRIIGHMKQLLLLLLSFTVVDTAFSQVFNKEDQVQVDTLLSEAKEGSWQNGVVVSVDTIKNEYAVKLGNGDRINIPIRRPEFWIRPVTNLNGPGIFGPSGRFNYQNRSRLLTPFDCRASEKYIKKNVWIQLAWHYKDFHALAVDFNSFKAQHGYDDKEHKNQQVYPYKIEMLVHLKRTISVRGKDYTEYQTWEFDCVYEYSTRPGKKCEFAAVSGFNGKLLFSGWFPG
jgi:hypothetical protein